MDCKVYAYYVTLAGVVVEPGEIVPHRNWPGRLAGIFSEGDDVIKLYLDIPEDFEIIKRTFFSPSYWEERTWQEEYNGAGKQNEKNMAWQDIEMIIQISQDYDHELMTTGEKWVREEYYSEILRRYNEWKKQK